MKREVGRNIWWGKAGLTKAAGRTEWVSPGVWKEARRHLHRGSDLRQSKSASLCRRVGSAVRTSQRDGMGQSPSPQSGGGAGPGVAASNRASTV